ncbi:hypothetical protein [Virgibacillus siamensis]|nr:hypothetical protein [Virgibacillus siamensis]
MEMWLILLASVLNLAVAVINLTVAILHIRQKKKSRSFLQKERP